MPDTIVTFDSLETGDSVGNQFASDGMMVRSARAETSPMVFNFTALRRRADGLEVKDNASMEVGLMAPSDSDVIGGREGVEQVNICHGVEAVSSDYHDAMTDGAIDPSAGFPDNRVREGETHVVVPASGRDRDRALGEDCRDRVLCGDVTGSGQNFGGSAHERSNCDVVGKSNLSDLGSVAGREASRCDDSYVEFIDGVGGVVAGTLTFNEIENIVPCFTPGTSIATPRGEILVEDLQAGDSVITRDNGVQDIRWIGAKRMDGRDLQSNPHLQPVLLQKGSLGNGLPERDMLVSPNHRMLVGNDRVSLYFDEHEVLVAAKHLLNPKAGVQTINSMGTTYIHFMFDKHEVVLANGAWTESFQPSDYTLKGMGNAQRNEIFELFPELREQQGQAAYASARLTLKKHEAKMLFR